MNSLAGSTLVVIMGEHEVDEARAHAQELATEVGAAGVGTLEGGFEAWIAAGLPVEVPGS